MNKTTQLEPELLDLPQPMEIEWPQLNPHALGCGVEDRSIRDRYEAAEYGWQDGVDKAAECVPEEIFTAEQMRAYALSAIAADRNKRDGCDQCGSKRAVGNPLYCNACHAAFSTHPADAKASVSATGTIARSLPEW